MGEVTRPWQFWIRSYVKWQIENKRAKDAWDEALRASREGQEELEAWRRHGDKQRRPLVLTNDDGNAGNNGNNGN